MLAMLMPVAVAQSGSAVGGFVPAASAAGGEPQLTATSAILMEIANGQVLFAKNPVEPGPMASTTKIMTALLALELGRLNDIVTVSAKASRIDGSRVYLSEGERHPLRDLLYALLLPSANDAAIAIAEHVGGTEDAFVSLMNERARQLGALKTHFNDSHGLSPQNHYTTAYDLALITREALKNPTFAAMAATRQHLMAWPGHQEMRELTNHNQLLHTDADITGVKTGYIPEAGNCLVASASRNGRTLLAVILHSDLPHVYTDARALLDYGFAAFQPVTAVRPGEEVARPQMKHGLAVGAVTARGLTVSLPAALVGEGQMEREIRWSGTPVPPLAAGQRLGELSVRFQGKEVGSVPLVTAEAVALPEAATWRLWPLGLALAFVVLRYGSLARRRQVRMKQRARRHWERLAASGRNAWPGTG